MCHHHCFLTLFSSNMPLLAPRPTTRHDGGAGLMGATAALAFINVRCPVTGWSSKNWWVLQKGRKSYPLVSQHVNCPGKGELEVGRSGFGFLGSLGRPLELKTLVGTTAYECMPFDLLLVIHLHDRHGNPQVPERMIDDRIPGSGSWHSTRQNLDLQNLIRARSEWNSFKTHVSASPWILLCRLLLEDVVGSQYKPLSSNEGKFIDQWLEVWWNRVAHRGSPLLIEVEINKFTFINNFRCIVSLFFF